MTNKYLAAYTGTAVVMVLLDLLWLGFIAKQLYEQGIGHLMAESPDFAAATAFYALFAAGIVVFAVAPQAGSLGWGVTLTKGALFGFFAYATYDLTNLATLRGWPLKLSMIDIAWGALVSAASAAGGKAALEISMA